MNRKDLIEEIKNQLFWRRKLLDSKNQQTTKKVELLQKYMKLYMIVMTQRPDTNRIIFIDAMANAGIYEDGDLCTSMEILGLFLEFSKSHPNIDFHLVINDYKKERIESSKWIFSKITEEKSDLKIHLHTYCMDVNEFLDSCNNPVFGSFGTGTVLFVDPYNIKSVKLSSVIAFAQRFYCEVIYNVFTSDFTRNKKRYHDEIYTLLGCPNSINNEEQLISWLKTEFKSKCRMEFCFSYIFKNEQNSEMYQIFYATHSPKGLEKLKEVLIDVFGGYPAHVNKRVPDQLSLFDEQDEIISFAEGYALEAQELFFNRFKGSVIPYQEMEQYLIEETMLSTNQILRTFLKPLLAEGKIKKENRVSAQNFKADYYEITG